MSQERIGSGKLFLEPFYHFFLITQSAGEPPASGMVSNYLIVLALYREWSIARLYSLLLCLPPVWSVAAAVISGRPRDRR